MKNNENINQVKEEDKFLDENGISLNNKSNINNNISKKIPILSPKAIPLVLFENGKFIIPQEAKQLLNQPSFNNIGIISLVGKYRTGKSFLLNRVLLNRQKNSGFGVGPTFRPCTKGIWIWSEPLIISNSQSNKPFPCFLIDTEGLGAYIEEINHDTKIFLIAILISSLFIYNSFGAIDEISLTSLSLVLNLGETIKIKNLSHHDTEEELAEYFPSLLWLLRDFSLKLEDINGNAITEKQYLEKALENVNGNDEIINEKNRVRKLIRTYFPERDCFTLVRPVENEKDLQNLEYLPDEELRKEFLEQSQMFREKIMKITTPKTFHKKLLSGAMLIELVENILDTINSGSIPIIENSWKYVIQNEAIKSTENYFNQFSKEIREFREKNKNSKDFDKKMKNYTKNLTNKYINELNSNELFDDDMKNEFSNKLKNKINGELDNFNKENETIFEQKFNKDLDMLSDKIINSIKNNNQQNSNSNFNSFFQELDLFKEKANQLSPDFSHKNDIILDKAILLAKKFIDNINSNNNKISENEFNELKNENMKQKLKISEHKQNLRNLSMKNDINIENLNNEYLTLKLNLQKVEEKLNIIQKAKEKEKDNYQKNFNNLIENYEKEIKNLTEKDDSYNIEINMKNEQLNILKNNNDKIIELNEKKFKYYENEINMLKEKIEQLLNASKSSDINETIKKKSIKKDRNPRNNELINSSISKLMTAVNDHIKEQNEDNKSILNKLMKEKEIDFKNDKKLIKRFSEIRNKNNELEDKLNKTNYFIKKLEKQINELLPYEDLINNMNNFKCKSCNKYFTLPEFKVHKDNCSFLNSNKNKINFNPYINPEKLKIRILKGKIKNGNSSSPYLEYIVDVNYNNTQKWRLGKKFKDFINLYNIINTDYKEYIKIPISNIFIDIKNSGKVGSFHENKIRQLELFINDIITLDMINKSQAFAKFIEFDKYYDEENELLINKDQRFEENEGNEEKNIINNKNEKNNLYLDIDDILDK